MAGIQNNRHKKLNVDLEKVFIDHANVTYASQVVETTTLWSIPECASGV